MDPTLRRVLKIDTTGCPLNGVRASTDSTSALFFSISFIYRSGHFVRDNCANDVGIYVSFARTAARTTFPVHVSWHAINTSRQRYRQRMTVLDKQINFLPSTSIIDDFIFLKAAKFRGQLADYWPSSSSTRWRFYRLKSAVKFLFTLVNKCLAKNKSEEPWSCAPIYSRMREMHLGSR